jgi:hypothetical protein
MQRPTRREGFQHSAGEFRKKNQTPRLTRSNPQNVCFCGTEPAQKAIKRGTDHFFDIRFRFLETTRLWDPYSDQPEPKLNLDMEIYGAAVDLYEMNPFDDFLNPMSCAYRYLLRTPFYRRGKIPKGEVVGDLQLFRKNEFHADFPQAWASDVMSLACLQHCLNRIGANIRIEILKNPPATSGQ